MIFNRVYRRKRYPVKGAQINTRDVIIEKYILAKTSFAISLRSFSSFRWFNLKSTDTLKYFSIAPSIHIRSAIRISVGQPQTDVEGADNDY